MKSNLLWFCLIAGLALVIRLVYLVELEDSPFFAHPTMDEQVHHEWAALFAEGKEWSVDRETGEELPYFRAPLYIWFLGTVYKIFGQDFFIPRLIQSILGALGCGLVFLLGSRLFGRGVGIASGVVAALYWIMVYFDCELLIVPLIVFLDILFILLLVLAGEKKSTGLIALSGFVLGLSALARPNVLLFAPAALFWLVWALRRDGRDIGTIVLRGLVFFLFTCLPILPVTVRNYAVGNDTVLVASQGGVNFYIGNNPWTDGVTAVVPGTRPDWWGGYDDTRAMAERALGHKPKPSEVSDYFFDLSFEFFREEPAKALCIMGYKLRYFFCRQEFANNKCIYTFTEEFTPIMKWLVIGFWIVAPLGLLGILLAMRRAFDLFPLWGFVAVYTLSIVLFFITARYRVPIVPFLIIYACFAIRWFGEKIRSRAFLPLVPATVALAGLFVLVIHVPGFGGIHKNTEEAFFQIGIELGKRGEQDDALRYLDRAQQAASAVQEKETTRKHRELAIRIECNVLYEKGKIFEEQEKWEEAAAAFGSAIPKMPPLSPPLAELHERTAAALMHLDNTLEAERHRSEAQIIMYGSGAATFLNMAEQQLAEGRRQEALLYLDRALQGAELVLGSDTSSQNKKQASQILCSVLRRKASILDTMQRWNEAAAACEQALPLIGDPGEKSALHGMLADILDKMGMKEEADRHRRESRKTRSSATPR